ncbi:MerR family transcriptional regulator [Actinoplanes regularis]|uniref:DNA-binding transcriptional regulator, MerR family n=1 Tax=Actinoplanes regularis TaxID=52697 RepID=A0A239DSV1_9ACTN|nr:MerR family transcriptional regulator [Actinoplanes regularis]GIE89025.1 MerR family transcriptional regulator [Actinoplanes regularis]SNS35417.1 DNA-binding transcriptional regulator, MerR family [Actinoplanes regularis]
MESTELLSIGEFARRSRLSPRALRLYDGQGILVPAEVDDDTGYRRYRESQLTTARLVMLLRRLDMPLSRVAEVLTVSGSQAADLVGRYWDEVERRAASQRELARYVQAQFSGDQRVPGFAEPRLRHVAEQTFITEKRHATIGEFAAVTDDSANRLMTVARRHAVSAGNVVFLYHGEISEDSDGPVEFCLPVDPAAALRAGLTTRAEPAHDEWYLRLTRAQAEYPQILTAYDAVFRRAAERGDRWTGPPREVYLGYFPDAAPDEEICDVALPIS